MPEVIEKSWNEYWAYQARIEHRHSIPGIFEWDRRLVTFIEEVCRLPAGGRILDLGCGGGDQARLFAERGYAVVGIDVAPPLVDFARRQFRQHELPGEFKVGDMREIEYQAEFDACVILSGTFGFFGDAEDQRLLESIHRALRTGGKLFVMYLSPEERGGRHKSWSENANGWTLAESWLDTETSTYYSRALVIHRDGTVVRPKQESGYHANEAIRCYSVPEMQSMLAAAGMRYVASYAANQFDLPVKPLAPETIRNIVVAERP